MPGLPGSLRMGKKEIIVAIKFTYNLIYLFLAVLGLHCCMGFSLDATSRGYSLVMVSRFLIVVDSLAVEHEL